MSKFTLCAAALLTYVGCATAASPDILPGGDAGPIDSPSGDPDAFVRIDAPNPQQADAPAQQQIDAPAEQIDAPSGNCSDATSGVLATWDFTGEPGSQATTPTSSTANGLTATAISRSAALSASTGSNSMNSTGFPTSATTSGYYSLSLTPPAGCELDVTAMAVTAKSSGSGPASAYVGTSADNFSQKTMISQDGTASAPTLSVTDQTDRIEIRVFGESATSAAGTMRVSTTLTVSGALH